MRRTSRLVLLAGIFLAALTFIVVFVLLQGGGPGTGVAGPSPTPGERPVVVAVVDIPLGTTITADMLTVQTKPASVALPNAFADTSQVLSLGVTNVVPITAGAQVTSEQFDRGTANPHPDPGTGLRAFAFSINETTGVGNLVQVGDHIDILITQNVTVVQKAPDGTVATVPGIGNATTVKMPLLLENIQIIGIVAQAVAAPAPQQGQPQASVAPTLTGASKLLIVAVTPAQAEVLLFARTTGTLDVVYRAADDTEAVTTEGVILRSLIDKYGVLPPTVIVTQIP